MLRILVIAPFLLIATPALACMFNTDCSPGSRCIKSGLYGVCAGGLFPGNSNDQEPVYGVLDPNNTVGNTCTFNTDCGPGSMCLKSGIYGVCVR